MNMTELQRTAAEWLSADGLNTRESLVEDMVRDGVTMEELAAELVDAYRLSESQEEALQAIRWALDNWTDVEKESEFFMDPEEAIRVEFEPENPWREQE